MKNFDYVKVKTLRETVNFLAKNGEKAYLLVGGTDVLVKLKQKQIVPEILIDIKGIPAVAGLNTSLEEE